MEHANIEKLSLRAPIKWWAKQSDVTVTPTEAPQWGAKWRPARPSRSGGDPSTRMTSLGMTADGQIAALTLFTRNDRGAAEFYFKYALPRTRTSRYSWTSPRFSA